MRRLLLRAVEPAHPCPLHIDSYYVVPTRGLGGMASGTKLWRREKKDVRGHEDRNRGERELCFLD